MKFIYLFVPFIALAISCKEIGPSIDFASQKQSGDTAYTITNIPAADPKVAYLEEFTGVACINCVQGHQKISDLLAIYGDRLVAVGVHSGPFSTPYAASSPHPNLYDFRTTEGDNINTNIYSNIVGQPVAGIDRRRFTGQLYRAVLRQNWTGYVGYENRQENPCNLQLQSSFDAAANKIKVRATVTFTKDVLAGTKLSLMLTENGIKDAQLLPDNSVDINYVHKHVLRGMFSSWDGLTLKNFAPKGSVFVRNFELTPRTDWRLDSCEVVGFVHESSDSLRVLQAAKVKLR